jgi:hypothetical protein
MTGKTGSHELFEPTPQHDPEKHTNSKMDIRSIYPVPIGLFMLEGHSQIKPHLMDYIEKAGLEYIKDFESETHLSGFGRVKPRPNFIQSTSTETPKLAGAFPELIEELRAQVKIFGDGYLGIETNWKLSQIWYNRMLEPTTMEIHNHANSCISVNYSLNMPEGSAATQFHKQSNSNNLHFVMRDVPDEDKINKYNATVINLDSGLEGEVCVFPSTLFHGVPHSPGNKNRTTIACDWYPEYYGDYKLSRRQIGTEEDQNSWRTKHEKPVDCAIYPKNTS